MTGKKSKGRQMYSSKLKKDGFVSRNDNAVYVGKSFQKDQHTNIMGAKKYIQNRQLSYLENEGIYSEDTPVFITTPVIDLKVSFKSPMIFMNSNFQISSRSLI